MKLEDIHTLAPIFFAMVCTVRRRWPTVPQLMAHFDDTLPDSVDTAYSDLSKATVYINTRKIDQLEMGVARLVLMHEISHQAAWYCRGSDLHDGAWRDVLEFFGEEGRAVYRETVQLCGPCTGVDFSQIAHRRSKPLQ